MADDFKLATYSLKRIVMVPQAGLEPALLSEQDFESSASTNSTTGASLCGTNLSKRRSL